MWFRESNYQPWIERGLTQGFLEKTWSLQDHRMSVRVRRWLFDAAGRLISVILKRLKKLGRGLLCGNMDVPQSSKQVKGETMELEDGAFCFSPCGVSLFGTHFWACQWQDRGWAQSGWICQGLIMPDLIAFCDKMSGFVDEEGAVAVL